MKNEKSLISKLKKLYQKGKMDLTFFFLVLGLLTVGLIMLFSASAPYASAYYGNSYHFIIRQSLFALGGVAVMIGISRVNYHILRRLVWVITALAVLVLLIVLVMPETVDGFKRWIKVGPITFQPSEVGKFALIVLLSFLISKFYNRMKDLKFIAFLFVVIAMFCGLVVLEHHLSATILLFTIGLTLMIVGGMKKRYIIGLGAAGVAGAAFAVIGGLISYGSDRITYWLNPWADATGKGFQTIQSLLAIGSGGIMGQGIGESNQKYLWLPEPQNDFIFAVVCEELGLIGAVLIIIAFALLVWRGFVIALHSPDKFGTLLCIGLTFQVGLQTILNMWVVTNTIPNTGISLPFFSYGGTALLMLLGEMGVVLSVSRSANMPKA